MANGIDGDGVEHKRNCLVPFLLMEANAQVQVQDYDVNQNFHGHVYSYGRWETLREKYQVLPHLQAHGDAFSLLVPPLEVHGFFHVYCSQAWNGDDLLLKALQLEFHGSYHG